MSLVGQCPKAATPHVLVRTIAHSSRTAFGGGLTDYASVFGSRTSDNDPETPSAGLVHCGSRTSAATPSTVSRYFGLDRLASREQYGSVRPTYSRPDIVGSHCRQSSIGRVGCRSDRFEDKSACRGRSIYPNKDISPFTMILSSNENINFYVIQICPNKCLFSKLQFNISLVIY